MDAVDKGGNLYSYYKKTEKFMKRSFCQVTDPNSQFYKIYKQVIIELLLTSIWRVYDGRVSAPLLAVTCSSGATRIVLNVGEHYTLYEKSDLLVFNRGKVVFLNLVLMGAACYLWKSYYQIALIAAIAAGVLHCMVLRAKELGAN